MKRLARALQLLGDAPSITLQRPTYERERNRSHTACGPGVMPYRKASHPPGTKLVRRFIRGRGWFVYSELDDDGKRVYRLQRKGESVEYRRTYYVLTGGRVDA